MSKFEIINPSDKVYIESDNLEAVSLATVLLGHGWYGLKEIDGKFEMPVMALGGSEWFTKQFGRTIQNAYDNMNVQQIIDVLSTVQYAGERTSTNNIGDYAQRLINSLSKDAG